MGEPGQKTQDDTSQGQEPQGQESPMKIEIPPRKVPTGISSTSQLIPPKTTSMVPGQEPQLWSPSTHKPFNQPHYPDGHSSWSTSSDKQLGSPGSVNDRVFPIRSVVSVDSTQTPSILQARHSSEQEYFPLGGIPLGTAGQDIAGSHRDRQSSGQSAREAKSRPTPVIKRQQETRKSVERSRDRKGSISTVHSGSDQYGGGSRMQIFNDATSENSNLRDAASGSGAGTRNTPSVGSRNTGDGENFTGLVTARFKHIVTAEGHAVISGRDGETLQRCEDEPIHIPGAVQSFGLLIALEEKEEGQLIVRIVSENSHRIIGYHPEELFKLDSFTDILSEEQSDNLLDHVDFIRDDEADPATNGPEVFTISIKPGKSKKSQKLWCALHINPAHPDLVTCEFELDDDQAYPLVPATSHTPELPEDTLHSNPTQEEYTESTHVSSKPLRVLRSARKRKGEAAAMEVFNIMSQVQEQLASAPNLDRFLRILVGVVKELTGFHRVMIYQFDGAFNGRVVTELVDPRATKDLYKGLNFPASDIPKQARELYKINKVRMLYDRDLETARLVCRSVEDLEHPLDLSFSYLRAMSPIHIKYLANMAVRSSMSISINAFNELWGLIACHGYGTKGMRVSFPIRKMCRLVGDTASRNIERLSYASRLQARKLINTVPTEANPSGYIIASSDDLLKLFDADFGLLSIKGETKILGKIGQTQEALAMLEYLRLRSITSVVTSQDIREDFPDLRYEPGFAVIAGLLLVPLSVGGVDFIVFFRRGQIKEVKWAGNPYEKFVKEGTEGYLEPRKSFKTWSETVVGKCREWTEEQVETAAVLCLVYGKFIEVWRQKEAALQNSQLTRLLLSNSAHEVRTPLNAIINYLEIALEGALDQETRDNLAKSHSASKSLIYVINDLLDLTKTEEGQDLIKDEVFDLPATIREATDPFRGDAKRKGIDYEVIEHPGVPRFVHGDQRRLRQAVSNITANAMQHTTSGWIHVEVWLQEHQEDRATIEIVVQDTGAGMSNEKLDALFRDLEQVSTDGDDWFDEQPKESNSPQQAAPTRTLGLGLAMVARIVRNMDGQMRLKSEENKGSRFVIQLPFILPAEDTPGTDEKSSSSKMINGVPPPAAAEGEVTLIDKTSSIRAEGVAQKRNSEEVSSLHSYRSGSSNKSNASKKSDVDRLIDSISTPLLVGEPETEEMSLQRSSSKGSTHSRKSAGSYGGQSSVRAASDRPGTIRSRSYGSLEHLRSALEGPRGSEFVTDTKTLLKAVRMPDEFMESPTEELPPHGASRVLFDLPDRKKAGDTKHSSASTLQKQNADHLQILVAEDDPVNSKIITKRLEKSGHKVYHTVNGEECASVYGEKPAFFDVVLMDMQMPIVDGLSSTKMIRSYEKSHPDGRLSPRAALNGRVPIFAVSASLVERERQTYINAGFDGWILKPIDFKRLNVLLLGIVENDTRKSCLYYPGGWEKGGWFHGGKLSVLRAATAPSQISPVQLKPEQEDVQPDKDTLDSSESGSITPKLEPRREFIHDERKDKPEEMEAEADPQIEFQALPDSSVGGLDGADENATIEDRPVEDVTDKPKE